MRHVFFSFDYDDVWRVNQVRNMGVVSGWGVIDAAEFEKIERKGDAVIEKWIDEQMQGTSVTVVLIGKDTHQSRYVNYEIRKSVKEGKGILGIHINGLKGQNGTIEQFLGENPLDRIRKSVHGKDVPASSYYKTYNGDYGYIQMNMSDWVEEAAQQEGR